MDDTSTPAGRNELPTRPAFTPTAEHTAHLARIRALAVSLSRVTGLTWQVQEWDGTAVAYRGPNSVGVGLFQAGPETWSVWTADETCVVRASRDMRPHRMTDERFARIVGPIALALLRELDATGGPGDDGKGVTS